MAFGEDNYQSMVTPKCLLGQFLSVLCSWVTVTFVYTLRLLLLISVRLSVQICVCEYSTIVTETKVNQVRSILTNKPAVHQLCYIVNSVLLEDKILTVKKSY